MKELNRPIIIADSLPDVFGTHRFFLSNHRYLRTEQRLNMIETEGEDIEYDITKEKYRDLINIPLLKRTYKDIVS